MRFLLRQQLPAALVAAAPPLAVVAIAWWIHADPVIRRGQVARVRFALERTFGLDTWRWLRSPQASFARSQRDRLVASELEVPA